MNRRRLMDRLPTGAKVLLVFATLYLFLVGIGSISGALKMMGADYSKELLGSRAAPLVSLFIGILATTLVQSSSTTTSVLVGMVASGAIPFQSAIYMVMGANVGTTVTNTIVSLGHIRHTVEYRRAFAAATVHDFFNLIVLCVLFPLEVYTGFLDDLSVMATSAFEGVGGTKLANPIKLATAPVKGALKDFAVWTGGGGVVLLILAITLTFGMLITLVKTLKSIMVTKLENLFDRVLFRSPYRSLGFGIVLTILVQSSSITTSVAVPLVGAGIITIGQVLPYTMGANIGTTMTALLASLAALAAAQFDPGAGLSQDELAAANEGLRKAMLGVQLAFHHVLFNIIGVVLVWPFRRLPIWIAESFAKLALWNRAIPIVYIVITFYIAPFLIILLAR